MSSRDLIAGSQGTVCNTRSRGMTMEETARNDSRLLTEHILGLKLIECQAKQEGYVSDSFPAICGFQENSAIIHYRAVLENAKKIIGQVILLIDSGGQCGWLE